MHHSCTDIRDVEWTTPAHREATVKYFKLQRACEEIQRLNIEICRLRTAIHDEETKTIATIDQLLITNSLLAVELRRRWQARAAVNAVYLYQLSRIKSQPAFLGRCGIGVRVANLSVSPNGHPEATVSLPNAGPCGLCLFFYFTN